MLREIVVYKGFFSHCCQESNISMVKSQRNYFLEKGICTHLLYSSYFIKRNKIITDFLFDSLDDETLPKSDLLFTK